MVLDTGTVKVLQTALWLSVAVYHVSTNETQTPTSCVNMSIKILRATTTKEREIYKEIEKERDSNFSKTSIHVYSTQHNHLRNTLAERERTVYREIRERAKTGTRPRSSPSAPRVHPCRPLPITRLLGPALWVAVGRGLAHFAADVHKIMQKSFYTRNRKKKCTASRSLSLSLSLPRLCKSLPLSLQ